MAITKLKIAAAILVAGLGTITVLQLNTVQSLREENRVLTSQIAQIAELRAENERLSKVKPSANASLPENQLSELIRLRGEVGVLRQQLGNAPKSTAAARSQPAAESTVDEEQRRQEGMRRMNFARALVNAARTYADANQGVIPATMGQAIASLPEGEDNELTNHFELVYHGPINEITNASKIIMFRGTDVSFSNGKWYKDYGFADGHSERHASTNQDFEDWERERIVVNEPQ